MSAKRVIPIAFIILFLGAGYVYSEQNAEENFGMSIEDEGGESSAEEVSSTDLLYRMVWSVLIVAGLGVGVIYLSRKVLPKYGAGKGKYIRVLESVNIGSGNRICLVETEDKKILIGSGSGGVSRLSEIGKSEEIGNETEQIKKEHFEQ